MEKAGGYLRRTDASPKKSSPLLDVNDVRELADVEIARLTKLVDNLQVLAKCDAKDIAKLRDLNDECSNYNDEYVALTEQLGGLLRDIAWVLRGQEPELTSWGFTGLDQLAAELIVERDEARVAIQKAYYTIPWTGIPCPICDYLFPGIKCVCKPGQYSVYHESRRIKSTDWIAFQDQLPTRHQKVYLARHGSTYVGTFEFEPQMHVKCDDMRYWLATERLDGWLPCPPRPVAPKSMLAADPAKRPSQAVKTLGKVAS
jgi:hypothetical protein